MCTPCIKFHDLRHGISKTLEDCALSHFSLETVLAGAENKKGERNPHLQENQFFEGVIFCGLHLNGNVENLCSVLTLVKGSFLRTLKVI